MAIYLFHDIEKTKTIRREAICLKDKDTVKESEGDIGNDSNFMTKLATFIVDKRNLFFLLFIFAFIFCAFASNWVNVENDITTYLPDTTETRQGLTLMDDEFTTYGFGFGNGDKHHLRKRRGSCRKA